MSELRERPTVLRITEVGEEILRRTCRTAGEEDFGSEWLERLIADMFVTMEVAEGCGLAANQVDVDLRLFVYDCVDDDGVRHTGHVLNPVVEEQEPGRELIEEIEGCLSVPGANTKLARPARAVVHGVDQYGEAVVIEGIGYFARCLQHETDHLNGGLYIDRLSARDRKRMMKQTADRREKVFAKRAERTAARTA
ncbi:peptide deformylase [Kitasatospora brasiliensis]|uniref:peptide deformylase n=1 Tax=Kitasatospora brasiliensis TaxID=3058040 RepID=UPI002930396C|nr:peptide deformylase [Kitasatospora sp. K002]